MQLIYQLEIQAYKIINFIHSYKKNKIHQINNLFKIVHYVISKKQNLSQHQ